MFSEAALIGWSLLALVWWCIAARLTSAVPPEGKGKSAPPDHRLLTVFKPLAPLNPAVFCEARGLESFISQLDEGSEMLLGAHEPDRAVVEPFIDRMRAQYPRARIEVVWRSEPDAVPNPKIAWLKILAARATGELWLWSDADIVAPPGFLRRARAEYVASGAALLTSPYVIREIAHPPALLDALFVNVEFFPGVQLLRRLGPVDFGLGAGMLFSRADFESRVGWDNVGSALADDFVMGQKLRPVRIGRDILTTDADAETWTAAIRHYLRWSKTIRWNRPFGTAARVVVLPVLGWIAMIVMHPTQLFGWVGLLAVMQMDVCFAALISRRVGCRIGLRHLALVELWSLGRAAVWLICWFPGPVRWKGRAWRGPTTKI
jgi:ceramide glucosyltransferase